MPNDGDQETAHNKVILDDLVRRQDSDLQHIKKIWINYTKSALPKRSEKAILSKLQQLEAIADTCKERNYRIETLISTLGIEDHPYIAKNKYDIIVDTQMEVHDNLYEALVDRTPPPATVSAEAGEMAPKPGKQSLDVPQINLTTFNGDSGSWNAFRDMFNALVHTRTDLSDLQKLYLLKTSMVGEAELMFREIPLLEQEYEPAWKSLTDLFENKRSTLYKLIRDFRALSVIGRNRSRDLFQLRSRIIATYKGAARLGRPLEPGFDVFVTIVVDKFDRTTRQAWEARLEDTNFFPDYEFLMNFLANQIRMSNDTPLDGPEPSNPKTNSTVKLNPRPLRSHQTNVEESPRPLRSQQQTEAESCFLCAKVHPVSRCPDLRRRSVTERIEIIRKNKRCLNCFRAGHPTRLCRSKNVCQTCGKRHHTLLHLQANANLPSASSSFSSTERVDTANLNVSAPRASREHLDRDVSLTSHHTFCAQAANTVLPTATVRVIGPSGACVSVRAILDSAAQGSFLADSVAQLLRVERVPVDARVGNTGASSQLRSRSATTVAIEPLDRNTPPVNVNAFILRKVSNYNLAAPSVPCTVNRRLNLADKSPSSETPILLLIGADCVGAFLRPEFEPIPNTHAFFQRTVFGWVLTGHPGVINQNTSPFMVSHLTEIQPVLDELSRFWALEEVPSHCTMSELDKACEQYFSDTHTRDSEGRYQVRLPLKHKDVTAPRRGREAALRLFLQQEKRLSKNRPMEEAYQQFLRDYLARHHMELASSINTNTRGPWYLPHHAVLKDASNLKTIRVVFNASFKPTGERSLNDALLVGPKLQADLFALVMRWRQSQYVMSTDIAQMFRQIRVAPADQDLQRILWRPTPEDEVKDFRLTTVTYGTACAPYLANRVLLQLAQDEGHRFPKAAEILTSDVYVDDVLFGADNPQDLLQRSLQLKALLKAGGFHTHKWATNNAELLKDFPKEELDSAVSRTLDEGESIRVLGITWTPTRDEFSFRTIPQPPANTKRAFLSLLAKLFDPLGWVAPITIEGKVLMQLLWQRKIEWDETIPDDLRKLCKQFQEQLTGLNRITIPRWTGYDMQHRQTIQVHGFADASTKAYAAVVYLRVCSGSDVRVSLVFAKTKVTPIKPVTIPRLELCAANLLVKATRYVIKTLKLVNPSVYLWSDSTVTLSWIAASPTRWKPFVANRVAAIQDKLPKAAWRYVPTEQNPADCASRGLSTSAVINHSLWWHGPAWLADCERNWPIDLPHTQLSTSEESRRLAAHHLNIEEPELLLKFSAWPRLLRVVTFAFRFITRARKAGGVPDELALGTTEIDSARNLICRLLQRQFFDTKRVSLENGVLVTRERSLRSLNLFRDNEGLIRVGGRLRNASIPDSQKHPVLIPQGHVARLLARHFHIITLHGGLQVSLRSLRNRYWLLGARNVMKACISNCVACVRYRAKMGSQLMGDLPTARVVPSNPFTNTGVDYAGPYLVRKTAGRGYKSHKAYIAIFVCLATRAIHIECVSDYSTNAFLAAFQRFVSRRGLPAKIFSDNGTTFVGADRELRREFLQATKDIDFRNRCAAQGIQWDFIPPASPHFGGLWEAGVKSIKHHLKRALGNCTPTFEEMCTLLCKIEAIVNSRPICPLKDDVESLEALTPGHFLIGKALNEHPTPDVSETPDNRLSRWVALEKRKQLFWKLWSSDYLNSLQQRLKWKTESTNLKQNDLVLVKHANNPPSHWDLGRVTRTFSGQDHRVRVVEVRTAKGIYRRPVTQLCLLPTDTNP